MNKILILITCCLNYLPIKAQKITDIKIAKWNGFEKVEFKMDDITAYYIKPHKPITGNPWIWRAHFPNWHTQMDSTLLKRGFYVAYINTNNLYGNSKAMMVWDKFYSYLVTTKHFASKVALEAVSRGGLYAYNWAKGNPSKVACIYAEAPVCDFKSWPGGKGKGKGSPDDWAKLLDAYGMTEEQALQFADQPKDQLNALASFKVPILHVVGLKDSLVPYGENTALLADHYIRSGGPATVIPMTNGIQRMQGHHFSIQHPELLANFIIRNSLPVRNRLKDDHFIHSFGDLNNFLYSIKHDSIVTVAFLGGSITHMEGWSNKTEAYLRELFPATRFNFINAGIPSFGSVLNAFRLQSDVLSKSKVDLLFIESAVNDHANGTHELQQRRALEGIIRHAYVSNPSMNMIMMAFADEDKLADYQKGITPLEIKVHEDLSKYYHLIFINFAEEIYQRIGHKEFTWKDDFKNMHPSAFGQEIYFSTIKQLFLDQQMEKSLENRHLTPLPSPLQKNNYSKGIYVSIDSATSENGFVIDPSWDPKDGVRTRPGFVNVPVLLAENPGNEFEFPFEGTAVGLTVVAGPDAGTITYSIDGGKEQSVALFTDVSTKLHLPRYILLSDELAGGSHLLKVRISGNHAERSKGYACRIVNFLVNQGSF